MDGIFHGLNHVGDAPFMETPMDGSMDGSMSLVDLSGFFWVKSDPPMKHSFNLMGPVKLRNSLHSWKMMSQWDSTIATIMKPWATKTSTPQQSNSNPTVTGKSPSMLQTIQSCIEIKMIFANSKLHWDQDDQGLLPLPLLPERNRIIFPGWWFGHPSEKYERQLGWFFSNIWKNKKCSKPPTSSVCSYY